MVINKNGTFGGAPGYARGNVLRTSPQFKDTAMVYMLPPSDHASQILPSDKMCKDSQRTQHQTQGSPRLQASPGDAIALRYQENGHVTLPQNSPGKPQNRGTIYVYGTTEPKDDESFLSVHKAWNQNGTGGDKRGVLLSVQNFDDGRCYQVNGGQISKERQQKYPHQADQLMGTELWCQQDIALPSNVSAGKPYTLYWVWDWPTLLPGNKQKPQTYTTCMDVDVTQKQRSNSLMDSSSSGYVNDQSLNSAAIPSQFEGLSSTNGPTGAGATQAPGTGASPSEATTSMAANGPQNQPQSVETSTFQTMVKTSDAPAKVCTPRPTAAH